MPINCRRPIYCRRQYQPIDMFWSIVQAMSIVVASPTSIVQDNNYKRTTFIGPLFKPCILRLLPRRPLFRTIAMDVVGLLFKPCTLWCMKRSTSCSEARGRGSVKIRPRKACNYPNLRSFGWVSYDKVGVLYSGKLGNRSEARASDLRSHPGLW